MHMLTCSYSMPQLEREQQYIGRLMELAKTLGCKDGLLADI